MTSSCSHALKKMFLPDPDALFGSSEIQNCRDILSSAIVDPTRSNKVNILSAFNINWNHIVPLSNHALLARVAIITSLVDSESQHFHVRVSGSKRSLDTCPIEIYPLLEDLEKQGVNSPKQKIRICQISLYDFMYAHSDISTQPPFKNCQELGQIVNDVITELQRTFGKMDSLSLTSLGAIVLPFLSDIPQTLFLDRPLTSMEKLLKKMYSRCCLGRIFSFLASRGGWNSSPEKALLTLSKKDLYGKHIIIFTTPYDHYFSGSAQLEEKTIQALREAHATVSVISLSINPFQTHPMAHHGQPLDVFWSKEEYRTDGFTIRRGETLSSALVRQMLLNTPDSSLKE